MPSAPSFSPLSDASAFGRVVPSARFVEATVLSALSDEFAALGTPEAPAAAPLPPADTNAPAFASFALSDGDVPFGWLWSPWPERTHAVFRKSDLREPRWAPVLGLVPTGPYSIWTDALPPPAAPLLRSLPSATDFSPMVEMDMSPDLRIWRTRSYMEIRCLFPTRDAACFEMHCQATDFDLSAGLHFGPCIIA